jgi:hypothetical protein
VLIVIIVALPDELPANDSWAERAMSSRRIRHGASEAYVHWDQHFQRSVTTSNMTVTGTPRVICTVPGVNHGHTDTTLVMTGLTVKVATAGAALLPLICL